jgi:long-chain acyl-CoA synthetase
MSLQTLNDVFFAMVERKHPRVLLQRQRDEWVPVSSDAFYSRVAGAAGALRAWGITRGDRIAILSENRPEWTIADFASLLLGAVTVPVYSTLTAEQSAYILRDSGARVIFVSTEAMLQKVLAVQDQTCLEKVVVMDPVESAGAVRMPEPEAHSQGNPDPALEASARSTTPDDLATIIYTSGTTGTPKGVMLTHGNIASNLACSLAEFPFRDGDLSISFLPLSHVTARHVDFALLYRGVTLAHLGSVNQLPRVLLELKPTLLVAVPRVYEKIHFQTEQKVQGAAKRALYDWALSVGHEYRGEILTGRKPQAHTWKLANRLVYSKIRAALGGRVELFISGGAPLGRELAEWYADVGIRIHEGYGLTETSPVIAVNAPQAHKLGSVGKPLPNVEVRIADDGEVLVRGPSVFKQYWNKPKETQDAFVDGWFKTGDIGCLDKDGFLSITDRKKDLIKTSGGKFIAPQPIENSLKHNALVAEAVVLGEKRKFPAALIAPNFLLLEEWARNQGVTFASRQELVACSEVRVLYEGIIETLNRNLARFEKLKRVLLISEEFSTESGTMTASMKLRRHAVEERYRQQIDEMYEQAEEAGPVTQPD